MAHNLINVIADLIRDLPSLQSEKCSLWQDLQFEQEWEIPDRGPG